MGGFDLMLGVLEVEFLYYEWDGLRILLNPGADGNGKDLGLWCDREGSPLTFSPVGLH